MSNDIWSEPKIIKREKVTISSVVKQKNDIWSEPKIKTERVPVNNANTTQSKKSSPFGDEWAKKIIEKANVAISTGNYDRALSLLNDVKWKAESTVYIGKANEFIESTKLLAISKKRTELEILVERGRNINLTSVIEEISSLKEIMKRYGGYKSVEKEFEQLYKKLAELKLKEKITQIEKELEFNNHTKAGEVLDEISELLKQCEEERIVIYSKKLEELRELQQEIKQKEEHRTKVFGFFMFVSIATVFGLLIIFVGVELYNNLSLKEYVEPDTLTTTEYSEGVIQYQETTTQIESTTNLYGYNSCIDCSDMTSQEKIKYVANCYGCSEENILDITNEYLYPESDGYDDGWAKLAKTGVIGVYEHIHTYMYGGKLYYGGASDFALVLYKNGVVEKYYPDFGLFPLEQQEINLSSTTEHTTKPIITTQPTTKPIITTQPTTKPKQTTEPTKQEVSTTVNYGTPVMSWGEIEGFNFKLANEIAYIDKKILDYYAIDAESYEAKGYIYLGKAKIFNNSYGVGWAEWYQRGLFEEELYTHQSFSNVEFFYYASGPYGKVGIAVKPQNLSSKITPESTLEEISRLFGQAPKLLINFDFATDFSSSSSETCAVFKVGEEEVLFFFDDSGKLCDYVYFQACPYRILQEV